MTTPTIQFYAAYNYAQQKVSVTICGLDCGDYGADTYGGVVVPLQSDADGQLTSLLLMTMDGPNWGDAATPIAINDGSGNITTVTVPVVIGINYQTQGQLLRPATQADVKTPSGAGLAKVRRTHQMGALLHNTQQGIKFGTDFGRTQQALLQMNGVTFLDINMFSGVYWDTLSDEHSFDSMLTFLIQRPTAATICSLTQFMETEER
jgi:hypothetical protein